MVSTTSIALKTWQERISEDNIPSEEDLKRDFERYLVRHNHNIERNYECEESFHDTLESRRLFVAREQGEKSYVEYVLTKRNQLKARAELERSLDR